MTIAAFVLATTLFHLHDARIDEASGVAVATREASVLFTHNDSGDSARFFALGPTGTTIATYDVDGARNVDWEDMAAAPNAAHVPTLWFGDIGDNDAVRKTIDVYATPEPLVSKGTIHVRAVRYRFRYPDGAHNAESLLVDPRTAQIFIATKSYLGDVEVYAAPLHPSTTVVTTLKHLASLRWSVVHQTQSLEALAAQLATTGGAWSPDGHTVALRTYTDVYLFPVAGTGPEALAKAFATTPRRLTLPTQPQGEGVAFTRDGRSLVLTSEHAGSAVDEVAIPVLPKPAVTTTSPPTTSPPTTAPAPAATTPAAHLASPVREHRSWVPGILGGVAAVVVIGLGAWRWRRTGGPA